MSAPSESAPSVDETPATASPRPLLDRVPCPTCGWLLPAGGASCTRCAYLAQRGRAQPGDAVPLAPLTQTERLFLAAAALRDDAGRELDTAYLLGVARRVLTTGRLPAPTPAFGGPAYPVNPPGLRDVAELPEVPKDVWRAPRLPLGTSAPVLREWIARQAAAWRAAKCPL